METRLDNVDDMIDDHETRIRWSEKRAYLIMGGIGTAQTLILVALQFYFHYK